MTANLKHTENFTLIPQRSRSEKSFNQATMQLRNRFKH